MMLIADAGGFVGTCGRFLIGKWRDVAWSISNGNFPCKHYRVLYHWSAFRTP